MLPLEVPPLRQRPDCILPLAEHFLRQVTADGEAPYTLDAGAAELLITHPWPGNIRQLDHALRRATLLATGAVLTPAQLPDLHPGQAAPAGNVGSAISFREYVRAVEIGHIREVIAANHGDKEAAAKYLGISIATLYRHLKRAGPKKISRI